MMTLEELLRDRAQKGELNYLSIAFTERGFEVAYMGVKRDGTLTAHYDPVCAVLKALTGKPGTEPPPPVDNSLKMRRRRAGKKPAETSDFEDLLG